MDGYVLLGVGVILAAIGGSTVAYLKLLKKRVRKYVLRYERIEKYYKKEKE